MTQCPDQTTHKRRLARTQLAAKHHNVARIQAAGQPSADRSRLRFPQRFDSPHAPHALQVTENLHKPLDSVYIAVVKYRLAATASIVAALLSGCGKPANHLTAAPEAALPSAQWQLATNEKHPISVGIAPGWREGQAPIVSMDLGQDSGQTVDPSMQASIDAAEKQAKAETAAELERQGILLQITDGSRPIPGELPTQYILKHISLPGEMDLENGTKVARLDLDFAPDPEFVDSPMGKAAKFTLNYTSKGGDKVHEIMYVFVDGKEMYELTFTSTGDNVIKPIADQVMQTLRIKPGQSFPESKP